MANDNSLKFNTPGLFHPAIVRGVVDGGTPTGQLNFVEATQRNLGTTSSFRYDPPGAGLRSSQQLNVDYSSFENHTFFQSAVVNVNIAFDRIINGFPFDGTRRELEEYLDNLTGFEKYVYGLFPKNNGYLFFSGSDGDGGTYVAVNDFAGSEFPSISRKVTGESILDPGLNSITFEMQLYTPAEANSGSVIFQKVSGSNNGITMYLSESVSTSTGLVIFNASSGSSVLEASASITKGQFNHLAGVFNRGPGVNRLELFVNESLANQTTASIEFGEVDFTVSPLYIGSGTAISSYVNGETSFAPETTMSGAMDEFRVFHEARTIEQIKSFAKKSLYNVPELKLYLKFNEPSGTIASDTRPQDNRLVLDYSGESIHGRINEEGFDFSLRNTSSIPNPMQYEKTELSPVLFATYGSIVDINEDLVLSATRYDDENPNLITRLVPNHYFLFGQSEEALESQDGTIVDSYTGETIPGSGELGQAQLLSQLLFTWAKFWDELKLMADSMSSFFHVSYDKVDNIPDQFLVLLARAQGFELPNMFTDSDLEQFIDAENLSTEVSTNPLSLQTIQNEIWRRILINLREIITSKGTLHSVKSFIRSTGIDPDSTFRIREYGGPRRRTIGNLRETRTEVSSLLDMSGSTAFLTSSALTGSRTEVGFPVAVGPFVQKDVFEPHGISANESDGLLTSGSFTFEGVYRWPLSLDLTSSNQSLMRLCATGSHATFAGAQGTVMNLVAMSGSDEIRLYARPSADTTTAANNNLLELVLTGVNIFDGNKWNISCGRARHDDTSDYLSQFPDLVKSHVSSSYFLRAARTERGEFRENYYTQSFFMEHDDNDLSVLSFQSSSAVFNDGGLVLAIGEQTIPEGATDLYLNDTTNVTESLARNTAFNGLVGHIRFWSKHVSFDEWKEHARNFKSLGVEFPLSNFNFVTIETGSYNRMRLDVSTDQIVTASNAEGSLKLFDFSQNNLVFSGSGFEASTVVIKPETFYYSHISPKFDEASTSDKVRPRSFLNSNTAAEYGVDIAPVYELAPTEQAKDDVRFTIDFSVVDALDQDIVNIFSTLKEMDNAIGAPELLFSEDYPTLENMREVYFNRLTQQMNLKSFFEFFKWFDRSIGLFIESLIPHKTRFRGVNFVVESHMLERAKFQYRFFEQYLGNGNRHSQQGTILLQQFLAQVRKF